MRVLELFSGTGSVGKVCKEKDWEVISLDLKNAEINCNILDWDYTVYPPGHFDIIWASPPCDTFSNLRRSWIGRKLKAFGDIIVTAEMLDNDMEENGLPILNRTIEIIDYFNPEFYFIENPKSGKMKNYLDLHFYDVDYCRYGFEYKKPTRIWTNIQEFNNLTCNHKIHTHNIGVGNKVQKDVCDKKIKYRIPTQLINDLFESII
tara:strand:- start:324 stop:938 length:615 start_codon:yes stop_codon:yes gene_type:complete